MTTGRHRLVPRPGRRARAVAVTGIAVSLLGGSAAVAAPAGALGTPLPGVSVTASVSLPGVWPAKPNPSPTTTTSTTSTSPTPSPSVSTQAVSVCPLCSILPSPSRTTRVPRPPAPPAPGGSASTTSASKPGAPAPGATPSTTSSSTTAAATTSPTTAPTSVTTAPIGPTTEDTPPTHNALAPLISGTAGMPKPLGLAPAWWVPALAALLVIGGMIAWTRWEGRPRPGRGRHGGD